MYKNYKFTIVVLFLFFSIGCAAYSNILNISGVTNIEENVWNVHYDSDSINILNFSNSSYTAPIITPSLNNDETSLSFETNLNQEVGFTIDVVNDGTFTARVSSVELKIQYKSNNESDFATLANVNSNRWSNDFLDFYAVWTDNNSNILDTVDLKPLAVKNMTIVVKYKQPFDYSLLPSTDMDFKFDLSVNYTQVDNLTDSTTYVPKVVVDVNSAAGMVNAIDNNQDLVLRLSNDIDLTSYGSINIDNNTTIEFNGNRIIVAPNSIEVKDGGNLILEDSNGEGGITSDRDVVNVLGGGTLIINGGTYSTTNFTNGSGVYVSNGGTLIMNDGTVNAAYYSIGTDGFVNITINGGELISSSTSENGVLPFSVKLTSGNFTMNGGKIIGMHGGLALDESVVGIINDGEIYVHGVNDSFYNVYITGDSTLDMYNGLLKNDGTGSVIYNTSLEDVRLHNGKFISKGDYLFAGNDIYVTRGSFSHDVSGYILGGNITFNQDSSMYDVN